MVNEVITLREDLDLVCVDQLVKELRPFAKTQVTVTRRGYDVDGHNALRLTELGNSIITQLSVSLLYTLYVYPLSFNNVCRFVSLSGATTGSFVTGTSNASGLNNGVSCINGVLS